MQAVILAGGLGTRLWPLTRDVPKPMVPVAGAPYLEHQIRILAAQEFRNIVLLTGYLGEQVEEHFGDGSRWGVRIAYSREPKPLGTGGALRLASPHLAPQFLLLYGDSLLPIRYREVLDPLDADPGLAGVLAVYDNALGDTSVKSNIALDAKGRILRYQKDAVSGMTHVEAGVLALRKSILDEMPDSEVVSLEQEVFPKLIAAGRLAGYSTTQRFYDIGTPERLAAIERYLTQ